MRKWSTESKILAIFVAVCVLVLLVTGYLFYAHGFTFDDTANTVTATITITEPTKTSAGAPLTNYKQTNIKTSVNGGPWATLVIPATSPSGGGSASREITFATTPCAKTQLDVKASGTNTANIEGVEATAVGSPLIRDRTLDPLCAPAVPSLRLD